MRCPADEGCTDVCESKSACLSHCVSCDEIYERESVLTEDYIPSKSINKIYRLGGV